MVIGITGGVGCGKSTVLNLLEEKRQRVAKCHCTSLCERTDL